MREYFIFNTAQREPITHRLVRVTVVFCPTVPRESTLKDSLERHFDSCLPPDAVLLLGTVAIKDELTHIIKSDTLTDTLPSFTRFTDAPALHALWCDATGIFFGEGAYTEWFTAQDFIDT